MGDTGQRCEDVTATEREREAARERKRRLKALREVVRLCTCTWPLDVMRNGDGHDDACPAHRPLREKSHKRTEPAA